MKLVNDINLNYIQGLSSNGYVNPFTKGLFTLPSEENSKDMCEIDREKGYNKLKKNAEKVFHFYFYRIYLFSLNW